MKNHWFVRRKCDTFGLCSLIFKDRVKVT